MSEIDRITKITDRAGTGAPNFTFGVNFAGSDSGINPHTHTFFTHNSHKFCPNFSNFSQFSKSSQIIIINSIFI